MAKGQKVPVSRRAAIQRINRVLAKKGKLLKAHRGGKSDLGRYYIVDLDRDIVGAANVDLEVLGRELRVIAAYETVEKEDGR